MPGWVGRDRGSVFVEHCVPLGCSSPSRCLSGHEKALSFHVGVLLSKVKGGFAGQAEQIADGSRHLPGQVASIQIVLAFKSFFFFCLILLKLLESIR